MTSKTSTSCHLLSFREAQIMENLLRGSLYKEIAGQLFISEGTVKQHVHHIYKKLKARNKTEAINLYRSLKM